VAGGGNEYDTGEQQAANQHAVAPCDRSMVALTIER
jgi:hypothetical protein